MTKYIKRSEDLPLLVIESLQNRISYSVPVST